MVFIDEKKDAKDFNGLLGRLLCDMCAPHFCLI